MRIRCCLEVGLVCGGSLVCLVLAGVAKPAAADVFPGEVWATLSPGDAGLDSTKLDALRDRVGGAGMIVRDGYKVYEWGDLTAPYDWASASKPVLSTLLFMADDEGLCEIQSIVGDFLAGGAEKDSLITLFTLANMTSGYSRAEHPGLAWAYNDYASNLYGNVLAGEIFDSDPQTLVEERFSFLQFADPFTIGSEQCGRIKAMSIRDFARLGLLWLNRGYWNGVQQIPDSYFDLVTNQVPPGLPRTAADGPESWDFGTFGGSDDQMDWGPGHYGMNFWVNTNELYPGAPVDLFEAQGDMGGRICLICPSFGMIATGVGSWDHPATVAVGLLMEAVAGAVTVADGRAPDSWARIKNRYRE